MGLILVFLIATAASTALVVLRHDRGADALNLLLLLLDLLGICLRVGVQPRLTVLDSIHDLLFLLRIELLAETLVVSRALGSRTHRVEVAIERVLCIDALLDLLVLIGKLLSLL